MTTEIVSGAQIRMARGLLRWSVKELSEKSSIGTSTIKRAEEVDGLPNTTVPKLQSLHDAFILSGQVRFVGTTGVEVIKKD
ncbi:MAG: hypothetical protein JKY85_04595 [Porticoccus sp.]|nr:hypothetical protein [Porticoccus sp.]